MKNSLGLYVHIPFCKSRCNYCDFYHIDYNNNIAEKYLDALAIEIYRYNDIIKDSNIETIYIGGGTPSCLTKKQLIKLFNILPKSDSIIEFTMEANPESITLDKLKILKYYGINRISLGVQSMDNSILSLFGRVHNRDDIYKSVEMIRNIGYKNLSIDLIYHIKKEYDISSSLKEVIDIKPEHISLYPLEIIASRKISRLLNQADDYVYLRDFDIIKRKLKSYNYNRYEISNYSLKGYESIHNTRYWKGFEYLGLGASASGFINNNRYTNISDINKYIEELIKSNDIIASKEKITIDEELKERFILGLRLKEGINLKYLRKVYNEIPSGIIETIEKYMEEGLLAQNNDNIFLTENGIHLMDKILVDII